MIRNICLQEEPYIYLGILSCVIKGGKRQTVINAISDNIFFQHYTNDTMLAFLLQQQHLLLSIFQHMSYAQLLRTNIANPPKPPNAVDLY